MPHLPKICFSLLLVCTLHAVEAPKKPLTLDDVERINFSGHLLTGLTWIDDSHYLQRKADKQSSKLMQVDAASGLEEPFYDAAKMEAAFAKLPGIDAKEAKAISNASLVMNPARTAAYIEHQNALYYYVFNSETAVALLTDRAGVVNLSFSPDGRAIAYVRNANIHLLDLTTKVSRTLTTDGSATLLNGELDWIYQEEVYGRGDFKSYWWSPDSKRIAYLQLNEAPVKQFTIIDHIPAYQVDEHEHYPKSGTPNPTVKLGVIDCQSAQSTWINLEKYSHDEPLVVRVGWTPDSSKIINYVCNREQTWLDVNRANPISGSVETLFRETTPAWVEAEHLELPHWLKDGTFLFFSERNGYKHLYRYSADGKLINQVTTGNWEVRTLHGVDETCCQVYFSGTAHSPIGSDAFRIKLDGSCLQQLTSRAGTHRASFSTNLSYFIDTWSDVSKPPQTHLYRADGSPLRVLAENKVAALQQFKLSQPQFLQVKTRDGFEMEAMLIKPPDFDPTKKYPVWSYTYSGPHTQSVHNAWGGSQAMWHQFLAQKGYLIWICDNRSASGKGAVSMWSSYKQMGVKELEDLEDGVAYLKSLPYVDPARIGLNGWSFGGYMTSYALTHSKSFKVGIAGGSVMDWHLYDSIYTERYMLTPEHNPEGYEKTSVLKAAKNLSGKLLLIHGTMDENVHMQNTLQFVYELQKAGKQFDLMLYPTARHGVHDPRQNKHMREMMTKYILDNL